MTTIVRTTRVVRSQKTATAELERETVVLSFEKGEYFGLNPVGSEILKQAQEPLTVEALLRNLCRIFDATEERIEGDVMPFLAEAVDAGLLEIV